MVSAAASRWPGTHRAKDCRSPNLRLALSAVPFRARSRGCLQPRDAGALASERVPSVLASEVAPWCRQARGLGRHPRFDPDDQPRQPVVGCATYSWRAAETRYWYRPVDGRQVHVTGSRPTLARLAGIPAQSHRPHRRPRSVRRADDRVQPALRAGHPASGAATARLDQCDSKSNRRVDRQQITEAFPWDEASRYLIRDRDTSYGAAVTRRLRAMGIRDRPIMPRSPWQNGHVERLIGSIRRECLDHIVVLGKRHLRHLLANYATKDAPLYR